MSKSWRDHLERNPRGKIRIWVAEAIFKRRMIWASQCDCSELDYFVHNCRSWDELCLRVVEQCLLKQYQGNHIYVLIINKYTKQSKKKASSKWNAKINISFSRKRTADIHFLCLISAKFSFQYTKIEPDAWISLPVNWTWHWRLRHPRCVKPERLQRHCHGSCKK